MKVVIALILALSACEFVGPAIAGVGGLEATSGFDAADAVCIVTGIAMFFLSQFIASFF